MGTDTKTRVEWAIDLRPVALNDKARRQIEQAIRDHREPLKCSFCGKSRREVKRLVAAETGACICDECFDLCATLMGGS